jgi:hypothetical protein
MPGAATHCRVQPEAALGAACPRLPATVLDRIAAFAVLGPPVHILHPAGACAPSARPPPRPAAARWVVGTYGILEEGFDDCFIDTMLLTTPRSKVQ